MRAISLLEKTERRRRELFCCYAEGLLSPVFKDRIFTEEEIDNLEEEKAKRALKNLRNRLAEIEEVNT